MTSENLKPVESPRPDARAFRLSHNGRLLTNRDGRVIYRVPGVARVATSLKQNRAFVTAQQSREPSPRALWEAVEQAGFQPVEMSGPGGTFREKPAS